MKKSFDERRAHGSVATRGALAKREKRKLIAMGVGLVALLIAYGISRFQADKYRAAEDDSLPAAPPMQERVAVPDIDVERLERAVSDTAKADRVVLERPAVDQLLETSRNLTPSHFEVLGAEELDRERVEALLADPAAHRGRAFTARGWLTSLRTRQPGGGRPTEVHGRLTLADESAVYFIAATAPDELTRGDFARVDGLLLKAFNDEDPDDPGKWVEGPLLVAPTVQPSHSPLGEVTSLSPGVFLDVTDDDVSGGITGLPPRPLWTLIAYAKSDASDEVDWESAPELDTQAVNEMLADGASWRIEPFRLPPTKLMGIWTQRAGENPARIEEVTEGWIGSWTWTGEAKVLRFTAPEPRPDLKQGDLVTGRGFFFKNLAYAPQGGGMRLASMVVMDRLEKFVPPTNHSVEQIWVGVIASVIGLTGLFVFLTLRDRKRSARIEAKLVERRRARRARNADGGDVAAQASPPGS